MQTLIRWFIGHRVAANLAMLCILILGFISIPHIRHELLPNVELDRISIQVVMQGASVNTVHQHVCIPIEKAIADRPGGQELTSWSYSGLCSITLDLADGYNAEAFLADIRSRLASPTLLPPKADTPDIQLLRVRNRALRLIVSGPDHYADLFQHAQQIKRGIQSQPAITEVQLHDHETPEIRIQFKLHDLHRYPLQLSHVNQSLREQTATVAGGLLERSDGDMIISSTQALRSVADYANLTLTQPNQHGSIPLGHVAHIQDTRTSAHALAKLNGKPALALDIYRSGEADITAISNAVRDYLIHHPPPAGVDVLIWQDESVNFNERLQLLLNNAFTGLILLFIVLMLFLNARLSFWVAVGIVVAFTGTLILLPITDTSINFISLFAFVLVLGIVVDDAVVVGESIFARQEQGLSAPDAALAGVMDVYRPVLFSVVTTIVAFTPLLFLPGPEGMLIKAVPIVVITTLLFSLFESLCVLPAHVRHHDATAHRANRIQQQFSRLLQWLLQRVYVPVLTTCIHNPWGVICSFSSAFALVLILIVQGWIQSALFSDIEGNVVTATVSFPHGTARAETERALDEMALAAQRVNTNNKTAAGQSIQHIYQVVAPNLLPSDQTIHLRAEHTGQVQLELPPASKRTLNTQDIIRLWRNEMGTLAGIEDIEFSGSVNPRNADIQVEFFGADDDKLHIAAQRLSTYLQQLAGIYSLQRQPDNNVMQIDLQLNETAQASGVRRGPIMQQINQAFYGQTIHRFYDDDAEIEVRTQLADADRTSIWHLENLPVTVTRNDVNADEVVAVKHLGTLTEQSVTPYIRQYMQSPVVMVSAYTDSALNNAERIKKTLYEHVLPELVRDLPDVEWQAGGHQRAVQSFLELLSRYYLIAVLVMYLLMAVLFSSYLQPLLVLFAIPFGLLGAVAGHLLLGLELTLWSYVGMVAVSGVVVNDNLVLLDRLNQLKTSSITLHDALVQACSSRFRPILLTSLTTFAGVLPLLSETSIQAQLLIPMAASLGFGVLFATVISLLLVPALCVAILPLSAQIGTRADLDNTPSSL